MDDPLNPPVRGPLVMIQPSRHSNENRGFTRDQYKFFARVVGINGYKLITGLTLFVLPNLIWNLSEGRGSSLKASGAPKTPSISTISLASNPHTLLASPTQPPL